ncbi:MAG TPA: hypothetical protein VD970_13610, partial [Acetobacteraceae bacterium]|nr:hypothetical protein [Acetobacteraceae bacterium]
MLRDVPEATSVFSRIPVHGAVDPFPDSYDWESMLRAAELLAHAAPGVILWNGSKGGAIGFDRDRELCARIMEHTGIAAETSALVLERLLRAQGITRIAFVTPYAEAYQHRLISRFEAEGFNTVAESHLGLTDNLSYAFVPYATILHQARAVAAARPEVILAWCTNYPAAPVAAAVEEATGVAFWDATALGVKGALDRLGTPGPGAAWGSLFAGVA